MFDFGIETISFGECSKIPFQLFSCNRKVEKNVSSLLCTLPKKELRGLSHELETVRRCMG